MNPRLISTKIYKAATTDILYARGIAYFTVVAVLFLCYDIVKISSGISSYATPAVLKTIAIAFSISLLLEYKKNDPILKKITLGTWGGKQ
jgi:hypothetical protein